MVYEIWYPKFTQLCLPVAKSAVADLQQAHRVLDIKIITMAQYNT